MASVDSNSTVAAPGAGQRQGSLLGGSAAMAAATMLSRCCGLAREMLTARVLGGGAMATAWALAFTIPNLFRRLLGEGAVGVAMVPMIRHSLGKDATGEAARRDLAVATLAVGLTLAALAVLIGGAAMAAAPFVEVERLRLTLEILPLLMPYAALICLAGVFGAALNSVGKFFLPALNAALLNLVLIAALVYLWKFPSDSPLFTLRTMSAAALVAGAAQLAGMTWLLRRQGLAPRISRQALKGGGDSLSELWRLTLPGLIGASALQFSLLADRGIATYISDYAVPALAYSDRIVYLPIGVFAVSVGTVAMSAMARFAAEGNFSAMLRTLEAGLRHLLFICVPVAVYVFVYRLALINLFYRGGAFGESEAAETALALQYYSLGIPAFAAIKVLVAGFNARKDTRTPMRVSLLCITLNLALNLALMWPLRQGGIALATTISSYVNCAILFLLLRRRFPELRADAAASALKLLAIAVAAVLATLKIMELARPLLPAAAANSELCHVLLSGTTFVGIYLVATLALGLGGIKSRRS